MNSPISLRFPAGSTHLLIGVSGSGKTERMANMLREKDILFENGPFIDNIIFCYADWQQVYTDLREEGIVTTWVNKLLNNDEFVKMVEPFRYKGGSIVVFDDFMSDMGMDVKKIIMNSARHYNATTFLLQQSLFPVGNKVAREVSLNSKFLHMFKNPRDNAQFGVLARQLRPGPKEAVWLIKAYHDVTSEPFTCFLIDLMPQTPNHLQFRSHYLPYEFPMRVYVKK